MNFDECYQRKVIESTYDTETIKLIPTEKRLHSPLSILSLYAKDNARWLFNETYKKRTLRINNVTEIE